MLPTLLSSAVTSTDAPVSSATAVATGAASTSAMSSAAAGASALTAEELRDAGDAACITGHYKEASRFFKQALRLAPTDTVNYLALCRAAILLNEDSSTEEKLKETLARLKIIIGGTNKFYLERLVEATNSTIYKIKPRNTSDANGKELAFKIPGKATSTAICMEAILQLYCAHENIVSFYSMMAWPSKSKTSYHLGLVMELMPKLTLDDLIQTGKLTSDEARVIAKDITAAVAHMHDRRILHRDIKAENILVSDTKRAKLADFGYAVPIKTAEREVSIIGTLFHMAPEILLQPPRFSTKSDIYALAIVFWQLFTGIRQVDIYAHDKTLMGKLVAVGEISERFPIMSDYHQTAGGVYRPYLPTKQYSTLLGNISIRGTRAEPEERPTASEIFAELG